jgi:hypothetical protein
MRRTRGLLLAIAVVAVLAPSGSSVAAKGGSGRRWRSDGRRGQAPAGWNVAAGVVRSDERAGRDRRPSIRAESCRQADLHTRRQRLGTHRSGRPSAGRSRRELVHRHLPRRRQSPGGGSPRGVLVDRGLGRDPSGPALRVCRTATTYPLHAPRRTRRSQDPRRPALEEGSAVEGRTRAATSAATWAPRRAIAAPLLLPQGRSAVGHRSRHLLPRS